MHAGRATTSPSRTSARGAITPTADRDFFLLKKGFHHLLPGLDLRLNDNATNLDDVLVDPELLFQQLEPLVGLVMGNGLGHAAATAAGMQQFPFKHD